MASTAMRTPVLPPEVLTLILESITPNRDDSGVTLARAAQASSILWKASSRPSIWETHFKARYTHSKESIRNKRAWESNSNRNWRVMYAERRRLDLEALDLLHKLASSREGRYGHARTLYKLGWDVWDILKLQTECGFRVFDKIEESRHGEDPPLTLGMAYWAKEIMTMISRAFALSLWADVRIGVSDISYTEAYSAISCFLGESPDELAGILEALISDCQAHMEAKGFPLSPGSDIDLPAACLEICRYMTFKGFRLPYDVEIRPSLLPCIPHTYLSSAGVIGPTSLVHLFVSIATSLGVAASPVGPGMTVLAHIETPDPAMDNFYWDVRTAKVVDMQQDLVANTDVLGPSSIPDMLSIAAMTILVGIESLDMQNGDTSVVGSHWCIRQSVSLAITLFLLFPFVEGTHEDVSRRYVEFLFVEGVLDCATSVRDALVPVYPNLRPICNHVLAEHANYHPREQA